MPDDKMYYTDYKDRLEVFISSEIGNLTVFKYMSLVKEIDDIKNLIQKL